jgi:membrane protease YdiL (CAAX protease family)
MRLMTVVATSAPIDTAIAGIGRNEADELAIERAEQHSVPRSAVLHILPGALVAVLFVLSMPVVRDAGLPPFMALVAADMVVMPLLLGALFTLGYRRHGRPTLEGVVLYRRPLSLRRWLWMVPALLVFAAMSMALLAPIGDWLYETVFGWLPSELVLPMDMSPWAGPMLLPLLLVYSAVVVVTASIVEELYFRGYLLPRLSRFGTGAAVLNVTLFGLYHLWTPWMVVGRIVAFFPISLATMRTRNVRLPSIVHVIGNAADGVGWLFLAF